MYRNINFGPTKTYKKTLDGGVIHFGNLQELEPYPETITERLEHWALEKPEDTFLATKVDGQWRKLSYADTFKKVKQVAKYLVNLGFKGDETVVILSGNSVEHALLALGALYAGITYTPISPAYSLVSKDFEKLKHCLKIMNPKVVFAQNSSTFKQALAVSKALFPELEIVTADDSFGIYFEEILKTSIAEEVEKYHTQTNGEAIAKILFTSGSTGLPKGVINTNKMWCANLQQITQVFPFMQSEAPVFVDWLPWNHTFGGNHNFGLTLYNGGTLYIDEGKPSPKNIEITIQNLREVSPTAYFNVPKGFEMLIPYLEREPELRKNFFQNLNILFYAGASLAQPVWDKLEQLALDTIGVKIPIITGLGCTESGPSAMFANWGGSFSGLLGVPVAGMDVKLVKDGDKMEARYKAPNVTAGYWRNEEETSKAFDEEGYYKTGDAVKFLDENNPDKGLLFDGRIGEDFKLSTGTWVSTGVLRMKVISTGSPIIQDVVLTGLDQEYIGAILFLNAESCRKHLGIDKDCSDKETFNHRSLNQFLENWLVDFNKNSSGSSTYIKKFVVAVEPPSIDLGEITDKGSINQRNVLKCRPELLYQIYELAYEN